MNQMPANLPMPSKQAQALSNKLRQVIQQQILKEGSIGFEQFMQMALYQPNLGYYSNDLRKFGEQGDFITAPEISSLFGQCIAYQCAEVLQQVDQGNILEFGAGSGKLAVDILTMLNQLGFNPGYQILELSARLRQRQQAFIQQQIPQLASQVTWLDTLPDRFKGVVVANEVLDAMPVVRFKVADKSPLELRIDHQNQELIASWQVPTGNHLTEQLQQLIDQYQLPDGYISELNLAAQAWISQLAETVSQGLCLLIDYGYNQREYYHWQRNQGSLACHYQHQVHDQALIWPGIQDITCHVNFSAIAEAGLKAGFDSCAYTSQGQFLASAGLQQLVPELLQRSSPQEQIRQLQAVKRLTLPNEMGAQFKVMALARQITKQPSGFKYPSLSL